MQRWIVIVDFLTNQVPRYTISESNTKNSVGLANNKSNLLHVDILPHML